MKRVSVTSQPKPSRLDKIPSIDIEFEDLSYFVGNNSKSGRKQILKSINGNFLAGQLTGILGPSGSGKSSLLNILAGYVLNGIQGNVKINGRLRQMETFPRLSSFIMQENLVQPYLTVKEQMMMAAHFKLGNHVENDEKLYTVNEILDLLRLTDCFTTRVENLSGGQKKRLSIALELIGNPPIIFLDEPTSGLDTVAIKQCIDVLKTLADKGRTVICTIHQPTGSVLAQFDQVYFIANGMCVYNGLVSKIPPFLTSLELECPLTYSHTEFVIEIVETNPSFVPILVKASNNGKNYVDETKRNFIDNGSDVTLSGQMLPSTFFWTQLYVLLHRMMLQEKRNKLAFWMRFLSHTAVAMLLGILCFGIGNDASKVLIHFKMCVAIEIFLVYCYLMIPIMMFPFEIKILKREYFNRWYGLKALYSAIVLRNIPFLIFFVMEFLLIIYLLTKQPPGLFKFLEFSVAGIIVSLTSEGIGLAIGTILNSKNGAIVGPSIVTGWIILMGYGFEFMDQVSPFMKFVTETSFIRHSLLAMNIALYTDRDPLDCPEDAIFCYYKDPNHLLKDLGATNTSFWMEMLISVAFLIFFRFIAYIFLRLRLNPERRRIFFNSFASKIKIKN